MTVEVAIRAAVPADVDAIADVHVAAWQWAYRDLLPADKLAAIDRAVRGAMWSKVLAGESPDSDVWVAEVGGTVVGFVAAGPSRDARAEDDGEIYAIYVREAVVGRGVGRALLTTAVDELRQRGAATVMLWVLAGNERALRFYEGAGWKADGGEKSAPWEGVELHEVRYRVAV